MERETYTSIEFQHIPSPNNKVFILFPGAGNPYQESSIKDLHKNQKLLNFANEAGYETFYIDYGFNGISEDNSRTNPKIGFGKCGNATAALLKELSPDVAIVAGHSLGSEHAIDAKKKFEEAKLVLIAPSTNNLPIVDKYLFRVCFAYAMWRGHSVLNDRALDKVMNLFGQEHYWRNARDIIEQVGVESFMLGIRDSIDHSEEVRKSPEVLKGSLMINGTHDVVSDRWGDKKLLSIPELIIVDGTHSLSNKNPRQVWSAIEDFIEKNTD